MTEIFSSHGARPAGVMNTSNRHFNAHVRAARVTPTYESWMIHDRFYLFDVWCTIVSIWLAFNDTHHFFMWSDLHIYIFIHRTCHLSRQRRNLWRILVRLGIMRFHIPHLCGCSTFFTRYGGIPYLALYHYMTTVFDTSLLVLLLTLKVGMFLGLRFDF